MHFDPWMATIAGWLWALGSVVPSFFVQTTIHEGAHAIFAMMQGRSIESFKVWPHYVDHDNDPSTRELFFFGRVIYSESSRWEPRWEQALRSLAPFVVSIPLFAAAAVLVGLHDPIVSIPGIVFSVWWVAAGVDLAVAASDAWKGGRPRDLRKGASKLGLGSGFIRAAAASLISAIVLSWSIVMFVA